MAPVRLTTPSAVISPAEPIVSVPDSAATLLSFAFRVTVPELDVVTELFSTIVSVTTFNPAPAL